MQRSCKEVTIASDVSIFPCHHGLPQQATLALIENGGVTAITDPYFDTSRCTYLENFNDASSSSHNLSLIDLGGVFLVLGMFVGLSLIVWVFRKALSAKKRWSQLPVDEEEQEHVETKVFIVYRVCFGLGCD